jgi:hypothetical protein
MAAARESFWNSRATGRDFTLLGLGLASGALSAALLMVQPEPIYHGARLAESPTHLSGIVTGAGGTLPVGMYQIVVADSVLWRLNTATGELHACGAGPSTGHDQLTVVCAPLTPENPAPKAAVPTPQPRKRAKAQLASF